MKLFTDKLQCGRLEWPCRCVKWYVQRNTHCTPPVQSPELWPPSLTHLGKGEALRHADTFVSQNDRPAFHQRIAERAREGPEVGYEGSAKKDVTGEVYLVVENILGSCCPTFLSRPKRKLGCETGS